jgi:hypothetical protein
MDRQASGRQCNLAVQLPPSHNGCVIQRINKAGKTPSTGSESACDHGRLRTVSDPTNEASQDEAGETGETGENTSKLPHPTSNSASDSRIAIR